MSPRDASPNTGCARPHSTTPAPLSAPRLHRRGLLLPAPRRHVMALADVVHTILSKIPRTRRRPPRPRGTTGGR